jgi:4-amino-4-deoxy-L-arabinose transferase-like glycosyltransferase
MFPWTPALALLGGRHFFSDTRRRFLFAWLLFGLVFFSIFLNKLPGYVLPLVPAAAALAGIALDESPHARKAVAVSAGLLCLAFPAAAILPRALAAGLSRSELPHPQLWWLAPVALVIVALRGARSSAMAAVTGGVVAVVIYMKLAVFPRIDAGVSARPFWREIAPFRERVCVEEIHRNWRYGLNYYSIDPLPDCASHPRPLRVVEAGGDLSLTGDRSAL